MKYYFEYRTSRDRNLRRNPAGVVVALPETKRVDSRFDTVYDAFASVNGFKSGPHSGTVSRGYLRTQCRRVTEAEARELDAAVVKMAKGE